MKPSHVRHRGVLLSLSGAGLASLALVLAGCSGDSQEESAPPFGESNVDRTEAALEALPLAQRIDLLAGPRQPVNVLYSALVDEEGAPSEITSHALSLDAPEDPGFGFFEEDPVPFDERLAPAVVEDLAAKADAEDELVEVVVTFTEDLELPRFPAPDEHASPSSAYNVEARQRAALLARTVEELRRPGYDRKAHEIASELGGRELARYWLINGMTLSIPRNEVLALAARKDVRYVEYAQTDAPPPQDNIVNGRAIIQTDPYFGFTGNWIGLLDTGVRTTHTLFTSPNPLGFVRDCVNGTSNNCATGSGLNPDDDCWNHGTATASIISGNNNLGNNSRGVTPIVLDSWKVYPQSCGGYNINAGLRAFQAAVASLDRVIVGEIQLNASHTSSTSTAANNAYASGSLVVAAAGNAGPTAGSIRSPGNAHRALAIGAVDVVSQQLLTVSGRGPTTDGRIKPDLLAPTNTRAASTASSTALQVFVNTSGATPYGAGAAALARNFMRGTNATIDPGQVYAFMILTGHFSAATSNDIGAGIIGMPLNAHAWWGAVTVSNGQQIDIPVAVGTPQGLVKTAIWWPDPTSSTHNRVSLRLIRPDGVSSFSNNSTSVWQKTGWASTLSGTWTMRIRGESVTGSQLVYYAMFRQ